MTRLSEQPLVTLTAALYEAATDPHLFPAVVEALCAHFGASRSYLHHVVKQPGLSWYESSARGIDAPGESFSIGVDHPEDVQREYMSRWVTQDGFTSEIIGRALTHGALVFDRRETCPDGEFERSPFHHEFAHVHEFFHLIGGAGFSADHQGGFFLLIGRPRSLGAFDTQDLAALTLLLPHLRRAQTIHRQVWNLRRERETRALALDALDRACLVVDASLKVMWLNAAAEGLLTPSDGLMLRQGQLRASAPAPQQLLHEAVRRCIAVGRDASGQAGDTLAIPRLHSRTPLLVTVLPTPGAGRPPGAVLFVDEPGRLRPPPVERLRRLYGLTPAEARVAALLTEGHTLEEICVQVGVTLGTVRNQLKQVFSKTDTHRQGQVVRLVLSLAEAGP